MNKFINFGFKKFIYDTLEDINFKEPTSIQEKVIPLLKKNKNIVALAHTGTGKTHSFLLPIINNINYEVENEIQAVIITPTRELAKQIYEDIKKFQKYQQRLNIGFYIGGKDINRDILYLEKSQPNIIVGTPSRIKELYENNSLKLTTTKYMIIDEFDMIFDLGFIDDVDFLLSKINRECNISVFSATIKHELKIFIKKYIYNSYFIDDSKNKISSKNVDHILINVKNKEVIKCLEEIINSINPFLCLIFVNKKEQIQEIVKELRKITNQNIGELHGDLQPRTRMNMLKKIKNNDFKYIVVTDIAARGIDINGVSTVISIDLPNNLEYYIHRSGRTGRNNQTGISYVIYNNQNQDKIKKLSEMGISFKFKKLVDSKLIDVNINKTVQNKNETFESLNSESKKVILKYKNKKIKPGYKKKRKNELDNIKKKIRRENIKKSIDKIKKEKYKKRRSELFDMKE